MSEATIGTHYRDDGSVLAGTDGKDHILYIHPDNTISLGRDVVAEWAPDPLHDAAPHRRGAFGQVLAYVTLTSPHTGDSYVGVPETAMIAHADGRRAKQLPLIRRLLDLPRGTRIPIYALENDESPA